MARGVEGLYPRAEALGHVGREVGTRKARSRGHSTAQTDAGSTCERQVRSTQAHMAGVYPDV